MTVLFVFCGCAVTVHFFILFREKMPKAQISVHVHHVNNTLFSKNFKFHQHVDVEYTFDIPKGGKYFEVYYYNGDENNLHHNWVLSEILVYEYDNNGDVIGSFDYSFDMFVDSHMLEEETVRLKLKYKAPARWIFWTVEEKKKYHFNHTKMEDKNCWMTFIVYNKDNEIMYRDYIHIYNYVNAYQEYKIPESAEWVRVQFIVQKMRDMKTNFQTRNKMNVSAIIVL